MSEPANVQSHCVSLTGRSGYMSWETLAAGGTLHLTSVAPYILCCSGLDCTLNGKIGDLNPGFLVEGFLWVAFPSLVEKRKNFTATFSFYPSSFLEIVSQIPLKALCPWAKLRFATNNIVTYHCSIFHLGSLVQNLGSRPSRRRRSLKQMCRGWMWTWRCNSGGGMNEGRTGTLVQGKSRQDVKPAALLFMSALEVESSGTDTANLYE